jgi:hypothetical protein
LIRSTSAADGFDSSATPIDVKISPAMTAATAELLPVFIALPRFWCSTSQPPIRTRVASGFNSLKGMATKE